MKNLNVLKHEMVPEHTIMSEEEVNELLARYGIELKQLPKILVTDPACKEIGARKDNVIKIRRRSLTAEEVEVGLMPIMVGSTSCNFSTLSENQMVKLGEDPADPGGYFIVSGSERVIITLEDLAPNKIFAEYDERYGGRIEVAKVFSQRRGYKALVMVERGRDSILEVSFPSVSGRINYVMLVRALGLVTDQDIVQSVSNDPEIIKFMLENIEEAQEFTQDEGESLDELYQ